MRDLKKEQELPSILEKTKSLKNYVISNFFFQFFFVLHSLFSINITFH